MFFEFPSANLDVSGLETGIKEFKYLCDVFQQVVYLWRFWDRSVCVFFVHASVCVCVCVGVCWDDSRCNVDMGNMCQRVRYTQIQDDSIQAASSI